MRCYRFLVWLTVGAVTIIHPVLAAEDHERWSDEQLIRTFNINRVLFEGNQTFSATQIRASLAHNPDVRKAMHAFSAPDFQRTLMAGIAEGYATAGFPQTQFRFSLVDRGGQPYLLFSITEGPRYRLRAINIVDSPPEYPPELIHALLTRPIVNHAPQAADDTRDPEHLPLCTIDGYARFDTVLASRFAQIINRWIALHHLGGHVPMQVRLRAVEINDHEVDLLVRVFPRTDLPRITAIRCEGDLHQLPLVITDWLATETGLGVGIQASELIYHRVLSRLRDSGCFVHWGLRFELDQEDAQRVTAVLSLDQHITLPQVGAALTPQQQDMRRLYDRLQHDLSQQETDYVMTWTQEDTAAPFELVFRPGQGMFAGRKRNEDAAAYDMALLSTADQTVWSSARGRVSHHLASSDRFGIVFSVSLGPASSSPPVSDIQDDETKRERPLLPLNLTFNLGTSNLTRGFTSRFDFSPMSLLSLAIHVEQRTVHDDGSLHLVFFDGGELLLDHDYRLMRMRFPEINASVRCDPGRLAVLQEQITTVAEADGWQKQAADGVVSFMGAMAPDLQSVIDFLPPELRIEHLPEIAADIGEKIAGLQAVLAVMGPAIHDLRSAVLSGDFSIPTPIPNLPRQSPVVNVLTVLLARTAVGVQGLVAPDAWPVVILSEASRYFEQVSSHGRVTIHTLAHDDRIGPLGHFCTAVLLSRIQALDTARMFAEKALEANDARSVQRELSMLLGGSTALVAAFAAIDPEAFSMLLPAASRQPVIESIRSLQAVDELEDQQALLPGLFEAIWSQEMQGLFRYAIEILVPESDLEVPGVLQQPRDF